MGERQCVLVSRGPAQHCHEFRWDQDATPSYTRPMIQSARTTLDASAAQLVSAAGSRRFTASHTAATSPPPLSWLLLPLPLLICRCAPSFQSETCSATLPNPSQDSPAMLIPHTTRADRIHGLNLCPAPASVHSKLNTARHMTSYHHRPQSPRVYAPPPCQRTEWSGRAC